MISDPVKQFAWGLYVEETAGDMDVRDGWDQLSEKVQKLYLGKAAQKFMDRWAELEKNHGEHAACAIACEEFKIEYMNAAWVELIQYLPDTKGTVMSDNEDERVKFTVLGRIIGTGTGFDYTDEGDFVIHDFEPIPELSKLPKNCSLDVRYTKGLFEQYDDEGERIEAWDMVDLLHPIARVSEQVETHDKNQD